jgi:hypothetical protein
VLVKQPSDIDRRLDAPQSYPEFVRDLCSYYLEALRKLKQSPCAWANLLVERASLLCALRSKEKDDDKDMLLFDAWAQAMLKVSSAIYYLLERGVHRNTVLDWISEKIAHARYEAPDAWCDIDFSDPTPDIAALLANTQYASATSSRPAKGARPVEASATVAVRGGFRPTVESPTASWRHHAEWERIRDTLKLCNAYNRLEECQYGDACPYFHYCFYCARLKSRNITLADCTHPRAKCKRAPREEDEDDRTSRRADNDRTSRRADSSRSSSSRSSRHASDSSDDEAIGKRSSSRSKRHD